MSRKEHCWLMVFVVMAGCIVYALLFGGRHIGTSRPTHFDTELWVMAGVEAQSAAGSGYLLGYRRDVLPEVRSNLTAGTSRSEVVFRLGSGEPHMLRVPDSWRGEHLVYAIDPSRGGKWNALLVTLHNDSVSNVRVVQLHRRF